MVPRTLLIVDADPVLGEQMRHALPGACRVVVAGDPGEALTVLRAHSPSVVALSVTGPEDRGRCGQDAEGRDGRGADGRGPDGSGPDDGLETLSRILTEAPATKIIALTPADRRLLAVRAVARGAHDVCCKPVDAQELSLVVSRAFARADLELEGRRLDTGDAPPPLRVLRDEAERRALLDALARSGGNLSATARLLGVSRPTLYSLLRQHGVRTG